MSAPPRSARSAAAKNDPVTKRYVDAAVETAMDAQRQYAETLFSKAEWRVRMMLGETIDERMKKALATLRPETPGAPRHISAEPGNPAPRMFREISCREQNTEHLHMLNIQLAAAARDYENATGLRVRSVHFAHANGKVLANPLVHNV